MTPVQYLNHCRLTVAARVLREQPDRHITDIALASVSRPASTSPNSSGKAIVPLPGRFARGGKGQKREEEREGRKGKGEKGGGGAAPIWGSWISGSLSWAVRRTEGRFQAELFGRPADPILASVGLAAGHAATNRLHLRLGLRLVDQLAPTSRIGHGPGAEQLPCRRAGRSSPKAWNAA